MKRTEIKEFDAKFDKYYRENHYEFITRKQAGVIFRNFKCGNINVDADWLYKKMVFDYACPSTDSKACDIARGLQMAVSALFESDYEFAQYMIDSAKEKYDICYC